MKVALNKFLENPEVNSDDCNNFYDWFCTDSSLKRRMMTMVPKLKFLVKHGIIDGNKTYVWFKNNCPTDGSLYDDMRISTLELQEDGYSKFLGGIIPSSGHNYDKNSCSVWYFIDNEPVTFNFDSWSSFKKQVVANDTLRTRLTQSFKV